MWARKMARFGGDVEAPIVGAGLMWDRNGEAGARAGLAVSVSSDVSIPAEVLKGFSGST